MLNPFSTNQKLPWMEDVGWFYAQRIYSKLFPPNPKNKPFVYVVGLLHLLGVFFLQYGVWILPGKYFYLYFIYIVVHTLSWVIFNNNCFMTLLTNYFGQQSGTSLHIRTSTAFYSVAVNFLICLVGLINPNYAPINILSRL